MNNINFSELPAEKYWSFPKNYKKSKKQETKNMIFSGEYLGSRKYDGAYYRFIKDENGKCLLQGRNKGVKGYYLDKYEWVPHLHDFFDRLPNGTCLLGELVFPNNEGSNEVTKIMGCKQENAISRQDNNEKLTYYIFDIWEWNGESLLDYTAKDRFTILMNLSKKELLHDSYILWAKYCKGIELWELLQNTLAQGGEGVVITKADSIVEPGKRKARKTLKIKKEINETIDAIIIDIVKPAINYQGKNVETWQYWFNQRTNEKIYGNKYNDYINGESIIPVTYNFFHDIPSGFVLGLYDKPGQIKNIGRITGVPREMLENWELYIGKIMEVNAMEIMKTGGLRHATMVRMRDDKKTEDCTIDQLK